ncbi:MAG: 30S ribosomal protein S21 [Patescibacteria group bacterium]
MKIKITKKPNETAGALVRRFSQQIHRAGILKEAKRRRHREQPLNKRSVRESALARVKRRQEYEELKRLGKI